MSSDLAIRASLSTLCAAFAASERDLRTAFELIAGAEARLNAAFAVETNDRSSFGVRTCASGNCGGSMGKVEDSIAELRRDGWRSVAARLGLHRVMSVARSKEHAAYLDRLDLPELTEAAVGAYVRRFRVELGSLFEAKVDEVFNWLRPRGHQKLARLKTNEKNARFELGPKVVLEGVLDKRYSPSSKYWFGYHVDYTQHPHILALESVFSLLDGKGEAPQSHRGELTDAIDAVKYVGVGETQWFRFKCHKNGRLHLEFKRIDLLKRINEIAGGKNLRPAREAT